MLNTIRRLPAPINQLCKRCRGTVASQSEVKESIAEKWQMFVAACITRPPILLSPLNDMERQFKEVCDEKEFEAAYQSDHELRIVEDKVRANMLKNTSTKVTREILDSAVKQTAVEFEDASMAEFASFQFPPMITDADKSGDVNSLYRALNKSLVLVSHQSLGKSKTYMLPQTTWIQGENLRESCDRLIAGSINKTLDVKIVGNAPCGFYNYKYSKALRESVGYIGAKVFFFTGHVMNMDLNKLKSIREEDHLWLTHDQLGEKLVRAYHNAVKQFLISDE